jgi:hypothetical protein
MVAIGQVVVSVLLRRFFIPRRMALSEGERAPKKNLKSEASQLLAKALSLA